MKWVILCCLIFVQAAFTAAQQLVIKGQRQLQIDPGQSITISLNDINVEADRSLNYPNGFYLQIEDGKNYTVTGSTITPSQGFSGKLKVKIRVTNGDKKSDKYNLKIRVGSDGDEGDDDEDDEEGDDEDEDDEDEDDEGGEDGGNGNGGNGNGGGNNGGNGGPSTPVNQKPSISGQSQISINKNQSFTLQFNHLTVSDPDNKYPNDFTLKIEAGPNYTISGNVIKPSSGFVGSLVVKVKVNDGKADSDPFNFQITVKDVSVQNVKPVITAQSALSTFKNQPVTIQLTHLSVTDSDDKYPTDFTLHLQGGSNYSLSGNTVTPATGFLGTLTVKLKVNDGSDDSNVFDLKINVIERGTLQVLGQVPIIIREDSSYVFRLSDLNVSDPSDSYPSGFSLTITSGSDYTVDGLKVKPKQNFFGNLTVPVRVSKGNMSSELFQALVIVQPVNDPPYFSNFDTDPIMVSGTSEVPLVKEVSTSDVDNTTLAFAEILLDSADNLGVLTYTNTANIRGVFDQANGILVFLGEATLEEYDQALQSINYTSNDSTQQYVIITFRLNDGESYSQPYKKQIKISGTELTLDIPTAFTPNGDNVNDTWEITPLQQHESTTIKLKIYNRQGLFLFESDSFTKRWDGRFNGEVLPADSYFFTIEIANGGRVEQRNGAVTILR